MTRREWFETLPPAYAERAIRNTAPARDLDEECRCLATAVGGGFIWVDTPEGDRFWADVQHGELPPIPGEEPAPDASDYPEPPTGFAVVMGPLARLATEYEQRDIAGHLGGGWIGQGSSLTSSTWAGCDEGVPYALRIGSQLAIDNGLSGIPDTQPAYRYFHIPDTYGVWRVCGDAVELACVPANEIGSTRASAWGESNNSLAYLLAGGASGQIVEFFPDAPAAPAYRYYRSRVTSVVWRVSDTSMECRTQPGLPWVSSFFSDEDQLVRTRNPNPCDEQGNLITLPAPASPAAGEFRIRLGYRYRTRGGATTGYIRTNPIHPRSGFEFEADVDGTRLTFSDAGEWNPPWEPNGFDLVEEITPTTIEEWLHTIPESEAALRNMESQRGSWYYEPSVAAESAQDAVGRGFSWGDSPEGIDYWQEVHRRLAVEQCSGVRSATALRPAPAAHPATRARATTPAPPTPPPAPKVKYRITEVRHYFLEAEDEIEADKMFRDASDPARKFRMHIEDREVHNDA